MIARARMFDCLEKWLEMVVTGFGVRFGNHGFFVDFAKILKKVRLRSQICFDLRSKHKKKTFFVLVDQ